MNNAKKLLIVTSAFGVLLSAIVGFVAWEANNFSSIVTEIRTEIREVRTDIIAVRVFKEEEYKRLHYDVGKIRERVNVLLIAYELRDAGPDAARDMILRLAEEDGQ